MSVAEYLLVNCEPILLNFSKTAVQLAPSLVHELNYVDGLVVFVSLLMESFANHYVVRNVCFELNLSVFFRALVRCVVFDNLLWT